MTPIPISEKAILDELHQLSPEHWVNVLTFIRSLRGQERAAPEKKRTFTAAELLHSGLVGMWADRTDLGDSREFARRLREQAQTRSRDT